MRFYPDEDIFQISIQRCSGQPLVSVPTPVLDSGVMACVAETPCSKCTEMYLYELVAFIKTPGLYLWAASISIDHLWHVSTASPEQPEF